MTIPSDDDPGEGAAPPMDHARHVRGRVISIARSVGSFDPSDSGCSRSLIFRGSRRGAFGSRKATASPS
jgi:hypothetical protein